MRVDWQVRNAMIAFNIVSGVLSLRKTPIPFIAWILAPVPPLAILRLILKYGQPIPWMDQWSIPGKIILAHIRGTLSLNDFFQVHNDSVKAFSGLLWFLLARNGWNPRREMVATWLITLGLAAALWLLLRKTPGMTGHIKTAILVLMLLFLFHPCGVEHWLTGLSMENALVIICLAIGLLVNRTVSRPWIAYPLAALLSFAATYSYTNGMLLWVLLCPALPLLGSPGIKPKNNIPLLLYLASALASIFVYFTILVASPYKLTQAELDFSSPLNTMHFFLRWLGAPFRLPELPWTGAVLSALLLALLIAPVVVFIRRRVTGQDTTAFHPWMLLIAYTLITGLMIAVGRQSISPKTALAPRYFQHEVLLPIALLPLAALTLSLTRPRRRLFAALYAATLGLTMLSCAATTIQRWTMADETARVASNKQARGAVALSFINLVPRNTDLAFLNPRADMLRAKIRTFVHHGAIDLPLRQPLPVGGNRPPETWPAGLTLDLQEHRSILVTGTCPVNHNGAEIAHILLTSFHGDEFERPFAVITPKLAQHRRQIEQSTATLTHFRTQVSPAYLEPGRHRIKAWLCYDSIAAYEPLSDLEWVMDFDPRTGITRLDAALK